MGGNPEDIKRETELKKQEETGLNRLLELKKQQETLQVLDETSMREKMALELAHVAYIGLTGAQMEEKLKNSSAPDPVKASVQSEDINSILSDYRRRYSKESWYKDPEPNTKNGLTELTFPTKAEAADFGREQAERNRRFVIVDGKTNTVMAYSTGDGKMYHSDGTDFKTGDELKPSTIRNEDFKLPERQSGSGMHP